MSLKIGVSGVRGIIDESLTETVISDFAKAYGTFVKSKVKSKKAKVTTILIGRDTRQSGEYVRKLVIGGLMATGCKVIDVGLAPTPTVLFLTRKLKAAGAIIITASHNPAQWNGLKFVRSDGTFLTKQEVEKLIQIYNDKKFILKAKAKSGKVVKKSDAYKAHLDKVIKSVDVKAIKNAKFKVALDYCNGTGAVTSPYLLKKLGCKVIAINVKPDGKFAHNPEPVVKNLQQLCDFVAKTKADVGFAQDPDADRLAIVSEKGIAIGEENTLALAIKHVLSKVKSRKHAPSEVEGAKGKNKVVVNLSTSRMADDIAKEFSAEIYRTAVGETNVVDKMRQIKAVIGGEGNGGVIYPAINFGRDSFIGMALILECMAKTKESLSGLVGSIKQYCMEKTKMDCPQEKISLALETLKEKFKNENINTLDGVKVNWPDGWAHARGSNTEPVIRIMSEAPTKEKALEYIEKIKGQMQCLNS